MSKQKLKLPPSKREHLNPTFNADRDHNPDLLIIGLGSYHQGDDEIGFFILDLLREKGLQTLRSHGDGLHLIENWSQRECVCLVDALYDVDQPIGTLNCWDLLSSPPNAKTYRYSTHNLDLHTTLSLAQTLDRLPTHLFLYTISAKSFIPGTTMNSALIKSAHHLVQTILEWPSATTNV